MAATEVRFHPEAATEYIDAHSWYAARSAAIADRFEAAVAKGVQRIVEAPNRWPNYDVTHRKLLLRRFPYLLIYREAAVHIWIVAVAHAYRRPGYWKRRTIS